MPGRRMRLCAVELAKESALPEMAAISIQARLLTFAVNLPRSKTVLGRR